MAGVLRSAFVIARRDFTATIFSRSFLLFLIGPLFPVLMGVIFGTIGGATMSDAERPTVAVIYSEADFRALAAARERLEQAADPAILIELRRVAPLGGRSIGSKLRWHPHRDRREIASERRSGVAVDGLAPCRAYPKCRG